MTVPRGGRGGGGGGGGGGEGSKGKGVNSKFYMDLTDIHVNTMNRYHVHELREVDVVDLWRENLEIYSCHMIQLST